MFNTLMKLLLCSVMSAGCKGRAAVALRFYKNGAENEADVPLGKHPSLT